MRLQARANQKFVKGKYSKKNNKSESVFPSLEDTRKYESNLWNESNENLFSDFEQLENQIL
jgi:hypothetical protein